MSKPNKCGRRYLRWLVSQLPERGCWVDLLGPRAVARIMDFVRCLNTAPGPRQSRLVRLSRDEVRWDRRADLAQWLGVDTLVAYRLLSVAEHSFGRGLPWRCNGSRPFHLPRESQRVEHGRDYLSERYSRPDRTDEVAS